MVGLILDGGIYPFVGLSGFSSVESDEVLEYDFGTLTSRPVFRFFAAGGESNSDNSERSEDMALLIGVVGSSSLEPMGGASICSGDLGRTRLRDRLGAFIVSRR